MTHTLIRWLEYKSLIDVKMQDNQHDIKLIIWETYI